LSEQRISRTLTVYMQQVGEFDLRLEDRDEEEIREPLRCAASMHLVIGVNSLTVTDIFFAEDVTSEERDGVERAAWMLYRDQHYRLHPDLEP
jgi:hypothetical protein